MSDDVAAAIDDEIRMLINQAHEEARSIITTHRAALDRIAEVLLEKETVDKEEVAEIFSDVPKWEHTEVGALRIRLPERELMNEGRVASSVPTDDPQPAR
jgi:cell division protease FtsH